jgi:hypothetical protein
MQVTLRKKLIMSITSVIVTALVAWLGTKNIDLTADQQLNITLGLAAVIGVIVGTFNIGQGIADKGKEAGKQLLIFVLTAGLLFSPLMGSISMAQDTADPKTCEQLLDECKGAECPPCPIPEPCAEKDCDDECGWKAIIMDKKIQAALITIGIGIIGYFTNTAINPP